MIIQTERLILREFKLKDAPFLFQLNSDPDVLKYTGTPPYKSVKEAEEFVNSYDQYKMNGFGRWLVEIKKINEDLTSSAIPIGWCGLKKHQDNQGEFIDLGFRLLKPYWGKGYTAEASKACIRLAFNKFNLPFLIGRAALENKASLRVLEKLGMVYQHSKVLHGINAAIYKLDNPNYSP